MKSEIKSDDSFKYEYSALSDSNRRVVESIRGEYAGVTKEKSDFERLKAMHKRVGGVPRAVASVVGTAGTLTLGLGMALILVWEAETYGYIACAIGLIAAAAAYPLYRITAKVMKEKYRERILALSSSILDKREK